MASDTQQPAPVDDTVRMETNAEKVPTEEPPTSDNDGGERPVRRKLRETTITSAPKNPTTDASAEGAQNDDSSRNSSRGRKRSFDEDEPEKMDAYSEASDGSGHRRKRSRDSNPEDQESGDAEKAQNADSAERKILSPKKKRSRDQVDKDEPKQAVAEQLEVKDSSEAGLSKPAEGEPEKKRHRDDSRERNAAADSKPAITNAFSNTSAVSPFGAIGASKPSESKEEEPSKGMATSSSAFASSSLAGFASSEQSPFGAIGSSTTSVFKKPAETTAADKPATTSFAAAEGPSPFVAPGSSGFATLGSGFGGFAAAGKPGGLTNFASPGGPSVLSSTSTAKPFGAPDEEEKEDETAESGPGEFEQEKTDERFYEQEIETGEEEEKTYFSSKAKLFQFTNKEWRERGIGTFKVNLKQSENKDETIPPRLIMRADGVLRVMLNTPIFKGMTVGDPQGNEPKSKQIHLASLESGRSVPILLRMPSEDLAKELYHVVRGFLEKL